jgi:hypothetical protein
MGLVKVSSLVSILSCHSNYQMQGIISDDLNLKPRCSSSVGRSLASVVKDDSRSRVIGHSFARLVTYCEDRASDIPVLVYSLLPFTTL